MKQLRPRLPLGTLFIAFSLFANMLCLKGEELLSNPSFEDELFNWSIHIDEGSGKAERTADGPEGANALTFNIVQAGPGKVQFRQPVNLIYSQAYKLVFWARGDKPVSLLIIPAKNYDAYDPISDGWGITLSPEWTKYEHVFRLQEPEGKALLNFLVTGDLAEGKMQFSIFSLEETEDPPPP